MLNYCKCLQTNRTFSQVVTEFELPSGVNVPIVDGFFNETSDDGAVVLI